MTGTTFKAGGCFGIIMMEGAGFAADVAILTAADTRHSGMAIGTTAVYSGIGGMVLSVSTPGSPGIGIMTVGTAR